MKKILLLAAFAAFAFNVSAQNGEKHERPTPAQMVEKLAKELNLTDDQKAKVLALNEEYADFFAEHKGHHGGPNKDGKPGNGKKPELTDEQKAEFEAHKAKHEEYNTKFKAILTDEQVAKWEENMKKRHEEHGHGNGNGNK
jgi:Spy/CpxP family protein refolding chaperone